MRSHANAAGLDIRVTPHTLRHGCATHRLQKRVTKEIRADNSAREFTYETTTSRLKKLKDAKGQEIQYSYLLDDRLQQVSYPTAQIATPTVSFTYDSAFPRLATMVDGTGSTTFIYHPIGATPPLGGGRLASVDGPYLNDTISYGYDELGRVVSRTLNSVTSSWSHDVLGRLSSQGDPIGTFTYAYVGTTGRLQSLTYPNGQVTSYAYLPNSGDQRLQEIHHKTSASGTTLSRFTYAYDAVGNIKTWTQQYAATSNAYDLGYDPADQLTAGTYRTTDPTPVVLKRYAYGYDPAVLRAPVHASVSIRVIPWQPAFLFSDGMERKEGRNEAEGEETRSRLRPPIRSPSRPLTVTDSYRSSRQRDAMSRRIAKITGTDASVDVPRVRGK